MRKMTIIIILIFAVPTVLFFIINNRDRGLTLGINAEFPPFTYIIEGSGGELDGFDVEIAKQIAKDYKQNLEIKVMGYYEILPAVQSKKIDIGMSTISITPERSKLVDFSDPYYETTQVFIVRCEDHSFDEFITLEDIGNTKRLGSRYATTCLTSAENIAMAYNVLSFMTWREGFDQLFRGNIDAIVIDEEAAFALVENDDRLMVLPIKFDVERYGVAVAKGNKKLVDSINKTIRRLKSSGEYDRLVAEYLD